MQKIRLFDKVHAVAVGVTACGRALIGGKPTEEEVNCADCFAAIERVKIVVANEKKSWFWWERNDKRSRGICPARNVDEVIRSQACTEECKVWEATWNDNEFVRGKLLYPKEI